ncbi:MAG: hypothetical protein ACJ8F7_22870 [Gemmataceae bacterium]
MRWPSARIWTAVRILLGCLLLTAAGLKLAGHGVSAVPQVGWFAGYLTFLGQ